MKKALVGILICALLIGTMGSYVLAADAASEEAETTAAAAEKTGRPGQMDPGTIAKVSQVLEGEIVIALAEMPELAEAEGSRPEPPADGERPEPPADGEEPPEPPAGGERPEPPEGLAEGEEGSLPGRRGKGMREWSFAEELTTYSLADDVTVQSGVGDEATALSLDDITEDSVVRLELDEDDVVTGIWIMPERQQAKVETTE